MRRIVWLCVVAYAATLAGAVVADIQYATGVVYHDANRNCIRDRGEKGIPGVRVSNSRTSVKTDAAGCYRVPVTDDTIIFAIKPRNWMTLIDANNVPRFYYIHKPKGSPALTYKGVAPTGPLPASVDFPLYPHPEPDRFKAVFLGDTQVNDVRDIGYLAHDIIEELAGTDACFAVSLGDIVNNDLSLYEPLLPVMGRLGIPCYYVRGNHDSNYDGGSDQRLVDETFERSFGPSHYSFDYGPVHFIVMDNPFFVKQGSYRARLDLEQMAFLRDDLAATPQDQLVVMMMHIPIIEMDDREDIYRLLESRPNTFSISAHWHTQKHHFLSQADGWKEQKPHHHLVNVTACGSWWTGWPDEVQIPHTTMRDGAPNGYSIITFDGAGYSIRFKAARRPADYQMNIYTPDVVESAKTGETEVLVNVFAGSERSKVEMRLGDKGAWLPMQRTEVADPAWARLKAIEDAIKDSPARRLPSTSKSPHMWKANLPGGGAPGTYVLHVRTTDMFGQTDVGKRILTIR